MHHTRLFRLVPFNNCWLMSGTSMSMCVYPLSLYRVTSCTSLAGRRVRVLHSLPPFPSFLLPPTLFFNFLLIWPCFSSRNNYLVKWWQHPSSAHWDENQGWDTLHMWCDGYWWQETVFNLPHDTQGIFTPFLHIHHKDKKFPIQVEREKVVMRPDLLNVLLLKLA